MKNVIEVKKLSKTFSIVKGFRSENIKVLKNLNFNVKEGDFIGIIGPNGSGKTTLLKLITKIYQPTKGEILVKDELMSFLELGIGLNIELTGEENTFLYGSLLGIPRKTIKENLKNIIEFSELGNFFYKKLKIYSEGMKTRLAFSIAALCKPKILIMDEILAVGDELFQEKSLAHIKNLNESGTTILLVTHDLQKVIEYCNKAIYINKGELKYFGDNEKGVEKYLNDMTKYKIKFNKKAKKSKIKYIDKENFNNPLKLAQEQAKLRRSIVEKISSLLKKDYLINIQLQKSDENNPTYLIEKRILILENVLSLYYTKEKMDNITFDLKRSIISTIHLIISLKKNLIEYYNINYEKNKLKNDLKKIKLNENSIKSYYEKLDEYLDKKSTLKSSGFGSKKGIIKKVDFIYPNDKKKFLTNEKFELIIHYFTEEIIKKPMFGIAIHSSKGILITGPNTTYSNVYIDSIKGKGKIKLRFDKLPLLAGKYFLSASIYDFKGENPIDHHYQEYEFEVEKNTLEKYGLVSFTHTWSIEKK